MRHRLYYFLPNVDSVRRAFDDMLLSRIEQRHIRFLSSDEPIPSDLPEAGFLLKTDVLHGAATGMVVGAVLGMLLGAMLIGYAELGKATILLTTLMGILFGAWASSMAAAALPNSRLKAFVPELQRGKILMIADVPARRVGEIERMLTERHPEMHFGGEESRIPVFP
jgi:hypothetical protein